MFKNLGKISEEDKKIHRMPKGVNKAVIDFTRNFRGEKSPLLEELYNKPLLDDLPF